ncbi:unnamed protein product [Prorocentrum cordatum]|nr:unnamed protein product [Polarella glacialis]
MSMRENSTGGELDAAWTEYARGSMTWEAWFRVTELPSQGRAMLLGTYGSNHDTNMFHTDIDTYSVDQANVEGSSRRRYGAVWLDAAGRVHLDTNVGSSTGTVYGPSNISMGDEDQGNWHHVAAVWNTSGGVQLTVVMIATNVNWDNMGNNMVKLVAAEENIRATMLDALGRWGVVTDGIFLYLEADPDSTALYRTSITITVNCPTTHYSEIKEALSGRVELSAAVAAGLENVDGIKPGGSIDPIVIPVETITFPSETEVGSATLFLDGVEGSGSITFSLQLHLGGTDFITDDIGMDGQLLAGGGSLGQALGCEAARLRLWSEPLSQGQLFQVRQCNPRRKKSLEHVVGGSSPFGLWASWALNGDYAEGSGSQRSLGLHGSPGAFANDSLCGHGSCPHASAEGCPLRRRLPFDDAAKCEDRV